MGVRCATEPRELLPELSFENSVLNLEDLNEAWWRMGCAASIFHSCNCQDTPLGLPKDGPAKRRFGANKKPTTRKDQGFGPCDHDES